jgi:peroxiredoxin
MRKFTWGLVAVSVLLCYGAQAQEADTLTAEIHAVFSKMSSMSHGYYTQAEWKDLTQQMDAIAARAESAHAWDQLVEMNRVRAMALGQLMRDPKGAIAVLKDTLEKYGPKSPTKMGRIYTMMADNYAQLGDEAEITKLIKEFEQSSYYNSEQYPFVGGQGREVPLTVTRPAAKGASSIIVTIMERARRKAVFGPGRVFPDAACTDVEGRNFKLSDLRGKVVVVDFFARGFTLYPRKIQQMATAYQLHKKDGLEIVSVNMEPIATSDMLANFAHGHDMNWLIVPHNDVLTRQLGIFGDPSIFVLDRTGRIVSRDIHEANLVQSIKDALGVR